MRLTVQPGRDLLFSPWRHEAHDVVFDANSGDFWIVSETAMRILEILTRDALTRRDIIDCITSDPIGSINDDDVAAVLDGLLKQGLIVFEPV